MKKYLVPILLVGLSVANMGSRLFDDASSQRLNATTTPVTAAPFTMCAWFKSDDETINQIVFNIEDNNINDDFWRIVLIGVAEADPLSIRARAGGGATRFAETTTDYSANTWHHGCVVEASTTDRRAFIDGGSKATNTQSVSPSGITEISLGGRTAADFMSGNIGHACLWDVALTDQEIETLSNGFGCRNIHIDNLVGMWPINGQSPEYNVIGTGENLSLINAPTVDEEPPIHHPIIAP